jgi:hypothetical protein
VSNYLDSNSNNINSGGGGRLKRGAKKVNSKIVEEEFCLGQEVGVGGPQNSTNTILSITGGSKSNGVVQESPVGQLESFNSQNIDIGGGSKQIGGVYSDGPRIVYNKLNSKGPLNSSVSCPSLQAQKVDDFSPRRIHPIPAKLRKQNQLIHKLNLRIPNQASSKSNDHSFGKGSEANPQRPVLELAGVSRNFPSSSCERVNPTGSFSSAGSILCCSSIGSSEIRNCNTRFLHNHDMVTAIKVWKGATELGVEGEEEEHQYVERILINEKKEEEARRLREQLKQGCP